MDILQRQRRRMADDRLREMYWHFVGQALSPEMATLFDGVGPYASFESSGQGPQPYETK